MPEQMNHLAPTGAIDAAFQHCRTEQKPAFIPFITAGYPDIESSKLIALALQESGATVIELGIPYSDPLADGPVIQQSSQEALAAGMTFSKGLNMIAELREAGLTIPVIVFSYYNPILQYGISKFVQTAISKGANGVIIPDLPLEESAEVRHVCATHQFALIPLVAPTSRQRIQAVTEHATGFVYCVSSIGVTGVRNELPEQLDDFLEEVRQHTTVPLAVGFGISRPHHVELIQSKAEGIVIGSALIQKITEYKQLYAHEKTRAEALGHLQAFVKSLFSE